MSGPLSLLTSTGDFTQLSVSQVEKADTKQTGGCLRKWWFEVPQGLKPEQTYQKNEGTAGHELLRRYLLTGERPVGRVLMGKAVTGAILKGELPEPGPDMLVERRFSGQEMRDQNRCECGHGPEVHGKKRCEHLSGGLGTLSCACTSFTPAWVPLNISETLHLAGAPWDGAIDLVYRRGPRPVVLDHKFSSDIDLYAKRNSELIGTIQMPVYAHSQRPYYPDAREFELVHHYVSKKGTHSFMRRAVVSVDQLDGRIADIVDVVARMRSVALATDQNDVPARKGPACEAWMGCPHQSICTVFRSTSSTTPGAKPMALTAEEQALFDTIDAVPEAAPQPTPETDDLPPADDEDAALTAQLAAAQKALADKQAKRKHMKIVDVEPGNVPPPPAPAPDAPPVVESVTCAGCGAAITAENGSKLQSGWKHIGCPKDAPPPPAPKERVAKKKTEAPPIPPLPTFSQARDATGDVSRVTTTRVPGESASERAATAAMDAVRATPPPAPTAQTKPAENITEAVQQVGAPVGAARGDTQVAVSAAEEAMDAAITALQLAAKSLKERVLDCGHGRRAGTAALLHSASLLSGFDPNP